MSYMCVDVETNGLNSFLGARPFVITTCDENEWTRYLRVGQDNLIPLDMELMIPSNEIIGHNLKFEILMLATYGMKIGGPMHDTLIAAHIFNPTEPSKKLKDLALKYLGIEPKEEMILKTYMKQHKITDYSLVPEDIMRPYTINDVLITWRLFNFYRSKGVLEDPVYKMEMRLLPVLARMQTRGMLIDKPFCIEQQQRCAKRLQEIETHTAIEYPDVDLLSNRSLGEFLFQKEGLTCKSFSEKGNPELDEYHLDQYQHDIIPYVLEYRELTKAKSTYLDALIEQSDADNVIHCDLWQTGAVTGRMSCRSPNLQNVPKNLSVDLRKAFICRPNYSLVYYDYSQIELRLMAHYAKEEKMLEELRKPNGDLHALTAKALFDDVDPQKRDIAKRLNFGIIYGIGAAKFAMTLNREYPDKNYTYADARAFITRYYNTYQKVRTFTWKVQQTILDRGHVFDVFGRKYYADKDTAYKAVNYIVQGCAAGVIKQAMIKVDKALQGCQSRLLHSVHDELIIEVHNTEENLISAVKELMEDHTTFAVPVTVNIAKSATTWAEKQSLPVVADSIL